MAKILILIGGHLCTAPRPQKEAETLAKAGHEVIVRGFWFDPELVIRDRIFLKNKQWRFEPIIDFQPHNRWQNFQVRLQGKIAKERYKRFQTFSPALLGYGARAMLKIATKTRADLTIVHSEAGLWVGNQLLNDGLRVGVDFEDWFSEDLLPEARVTRPIKQLKQYEARLARECKYCLTTSNSMAEAISQAYDAPKPTVIYNTFPGAEREYIDGEIKDRKNLELPSLHWFSQTIGIGRGLETLFSALNHLQTPVEIHLRGNYPESSKQLLEPLIPSQWRKHIFIHPTVPNHELLSRIAEHDIGLALELRDVNNTDITVSNKLFQYLHGGLTVVATDTLGQKEILSQYPQVGSLIPSNNPLALANTLDNLLQDSHKLNVAKNDALKIFNEKLCWEHQAQVLLNQVKHSVTVVEKALK
ncbi:MAG: glycosyltransferase [Xenococcaceae cyanobacterium MO_207.B15]|nr:glycosyltransferase [Xenococcaceae cyanobacterium MO_207.B15]